MTKRRKIGLVLGSGGARGWAHLGVIRVLKQMGVKPDIIVGTSIGAMVGAMLAAERFDAFDHEVTNLSTAKITKFFTEFHLPQSGLFSGKPIIEWLTQPHLLGDLTFSELPTRLAVVATDLYEERAVIITRGKVANAVRASISIPGVFDPVIRDGKILVDGGLADPVPIRVARQLGADVIIAVDINTSSPEKHTEAWCEKGKSPSMVNTLLQTIRMLENTTCRLALERDPPEVLIRPAVGHIHALEFNTGKSLISIGEDAMMAAQKELESYL